MFQSWLRPRGMPSFELDAEVALIDLGIVADGLDRAERPVVIEAEHLAEAALGAGEAAHVGLLRGQRLVDVRRRDAEFLRVDQREVHPFHDVEPGEVIGARHRSERLLRDHVGQDDGVGRAWRASAVRRRAPTGRASARRIGRTGRRCSASAPLGKARSSIGHRIGAEEVGEVELARRAGLDADLRLVELERRRRRPSCAWP